MKGAAATAARLLDALEKFLLQEHGLLCAGRYVQLTAVQRRAAPLVARLYELGREPGAEAWAPRVRQLLVRRREHLSCLAARREDVRAARERLAARRRHLQQLASYRTALGRPVSKRLNAAV